MHGLLNSSSTKQQSQQVHSETRLKKSNRKTIGFQCFALNVGIHQVCIRHIGGSNLLDPNGVGITQKPWAHNLEGRLGTSKTTQRLSLAAPLCSRPHLALPWHSERNLPASHTAMASSPLNSSCRCNKPAAADWHKHKRMHSDWLHPLLSNFKTVLV